MRPAQVANKALDFKRNVLSIAGILNKDQSVEEQFKQVEIKIVDLSTGRFTDAIADIENLIKMHQLKNLIFPTSCQQKRTSQKSSAVKSMPKYFW